MSARTYIAIDLKSFYASVECVERGLDPLDTHLVVADASRTAKTICLAVSPSLKEYGIGGRARLFEVEQRMREVNERRRIWSPGRRLTGSSTSKAELENHPEWEAGYITAPPRMAFYIRYSTDIYAVYLKYVAPEHIHVYSIDEVFMDVTDYLHAYNHDARLMARTIVRDVLQQTGITATAGIGTNLYLCKVAMDIVAKHIPADADGVRIASLDEESYRRTLWTHRPLTDFWRVGRGTMHRLEAHGMYTMGDVARMSVISENFLFKLFGVNAELLIDHAWGWEPCTIGAIKAYRPATHSLSSGQVLTEPYPTAKARVVAREMAEAVALDLLDKRLVTNLLTLTVGYDRESLTDIIIRLQYDGPVVSDHYGRSVPKPTHGSRKLHRYTSSARLIAEAALEIFDTTVHQPLLVRRLTIAAGNVIPEETVGQVEKETGERDLFTDYEALEAAREKEDEALLKERKMMEAALKIKKKFGKNAFLKGTDLEEGATARERNRQIGGHKA